MSRVASKQAAEKGEVFTVEIQTHLEQSKMSIYELRDYFCKNPKLLKSRIRK